VKNFKYLGVLFTSDCRLENEVDRQMGAVIVLTGSCKEESEHEGKALNL